MEHPVHSRILAVLVLLAMVAATFIASPLEGFAADVERPAKAPARGQFTYPTAERNVIALTEVERSYLLNEMRYYLDLLWLVNESLARDDLKTVSILAQRRAELSAATRLPPALEGKLPAVYRAAWVETNRQIDSLAVHALAPEATSRTVISRLSSILQRCNECHTLYQFRAAP